MSSFHGQVDPVQHPEFIDGYCACQDEGRDPGCAFRNRTKDENPQDRYNRNNASKAENAKDAETLTLQLSLMERSGLDLRGVHFLAATASEILS